MIDRKLLTSFGVQKSAVKSHILEPLQYGLREDLPHMERSYVERITKVQYQGSLQSCQFLTIQLS